MTGAVNMLLDITERKRAETALRESEGRLSAELAAAHQLQRLSVELVHEQDVQSLYAKLVDAAAAIMRSDCASMQLLHPERGGKGELCLLAAHGFGRQATKFWEWVDADSGCTCGMALRTRERAIATEVETCDFMAGTQDRATYLQAGIHAAQSTPLLSRSGRLLGMLSTHWREPHEPSETDLQRFDVLARQAADLIERAQAETALRASEARLRESEAQFRTLADNISQFAWMADDKGWIFWYNQRWYDYTGTTLEQMQGWGWKQVHHPDHVDRVVQRIQRSWDTGQIWEDTFPLRGKDGRYRWFLSRAQPIRDADGRIVRWFGTNTDITEQRAAEEALRESEERFSAIFAQATAGIAETDVTGRFTTVNERYCAITGRSREELLRLRMQDITHPDDLAKNAPLFAGAVEDGRPFEIEKRYVRPDGSWIWVNNSVFAIKGAMGRVESVTAVCIDITEPKRAESALRESEELYRGLFNSAPAGVFVCGRSGVIQAYNARAAELWGRQPVCADHNELFCGSLRRRLPSGEALPHAQGVTAEVLRTGVARQNVEVIIERPDGSQISVLVSCTPLKSAQGEVTGSITSFIDISDRKRAQEQQRLLLREMNHRIKNLFALAGGVVSLSARTAETPRDLAKAVHERLAALARAHELTLLDLNGGGEKSDQATTLPALIQTIVYPFHTEEDARITISGPGVAIGRNAVTGIALLLQEMATNAAKYGALSTHSGRIDVSWVIWKDELMLAWREHGGPPLNGPPEKEGFGSLLARLTVTDQLAGNISRDWKPEGLTINLSLSLGHLAQ
ncbi:MAG: PAS domain S-box protein [Methylocella sp.]